MRRRGFSPGSFVLGLVVGLIILAFVVLGLFNPNAAIFGRPAAPHAPTSTPPGSSRLPLLPVTGGSQTTWIHIKSELRDLLAQINQKVLRPIDQWVRQHSSGSGKPVLPFGSTASP